MMKEEFEKLAGYEVSYDDYHNIIEPMYLAIPEGISKQDFVQMINKKRFALRPYRELIKGMRQYAAIIEDNCTHFTDFTSQHALEELAREYVQRKYNGAAVYSISTAMKQCCYYPVRLDIFNPRTFKDYETISLF